MPPETRSKIEVAGEDILQKMEKLSEVIKSKPREEQYPLYKEMFILGNILRHIVSTLEPDFFLSEADFQKKQEREEG